MAESCTRRFDEALLSGYVDGMLTQGDEQRVRIHLEDCARCRTEVQAIRALREVTMSSSFNVPDDLQWSERPRGRASRAAFGLGWLLVLGWMAVAGAIAAWEWLRSPEPAFEKLLVAGGVAGLVLLALSALVDRLRVLRTDRYREVRK